MIHTDIGWEESGRGMTVFWRRIVDEPDAFPPEFWPEFWQLFLQSSLTALGEKCRPVVRGHDMEEAHHRRGYATVAVEVGEGHPRCEAVWGRRTQRRSACKPEG